MEFGNKSRFAIAVELDSNHGGIWLFGRICYWMAGAMVGDYAVGTSLRDVLFQMTYIIGDSGKRFAPTLFCSTKEKSLALIETALDETSDEIYQYLPQDFLPARFDVRIPVDVFDFWKIFLVDGEDEAKLLHRALECSVVVETTLALGEFDRIFQEAHGYLERLYEEQVDREGER